MKDDELAASGKPDYTVTSGKTFVPIEIPYNYQTARSEQVCIKINKNLNLKTNSF